MNTMSEQPKQPDINIGSIERELTSLWKAVSEEDEHGGIIRACLLNLIVYVPDRSEAANIDDIITEVTSVNPSRALLMIADREAEESSLEAQVTSRCTIPSGMSKQVCCEQVTITAGGELVSEAPSVASALLLADLPVYLWWHATPKMGDKTFKRLADISDRVIIDSADFDKPHEDMPSLAAVIRDSTKWTAFSDLNWARLTPWRALIAGFYDVAGYRPMLDTVKRVVIEYAPPVEDDGAIAPRAALLAGWLSSRLGWKLDKTGRDSKSSVFEMLADGRQVTIEFVPTGNPDIKPRLVATFTLECESSSFIVARSADGNRIETQVNAGEEKSIQRVLDYIDWSESALIAKELEILGHDRVYEQAVSAAGDLFNALPRS